jgi:ribosomal-protein-alanine N-acetyltransferase
MTGPTAFAAGDADVLAAIHAQSFERPWSADEIAELLRSPGVFALGGPQSFILCRTVVGEAEVLTLAVAPAARRTGLGRAMLEAAMQVAALAGAETAFLEVAEDNAAALALYRTAGFRETGRRKGYYHRETGARDALVMRRALNSGRTPAYAGEA